MTSINLADYANIKNNEVEKYCDNVTNASVKGDSVKKEELIVNKYYVIKYYVIKHRDVDSDEKNMYRLPHMGKFVYEKNGIPYFDIYTTGIKSVFGYIHPDNQYRVEKEQGYSPSLYCFYKLGHKYTISESEVPHGTYGEKYIQFTIKEIPKKESGETVSSEKAGGKKRKTKKGKRGKKSKDSRKKSKSKRKNRK